MEIYFDNVLLDNENYLSFKMSYKPFESSFMLGSTTSKEAELVIPITALPSNLENVKISVDGYNLYFIVDNISKVDNRRVKIKLIEKLVLLLKEYDFSSSVPISAKDLLTNICNDFGIAHDTFSFDNEDIEISSYDNTLTARDYLKMICELSGTYATMENNKLVLKKYTDTPSHTITGNLVDGYELGDVITIERVVYEFGTIHYESSSDTSLYTLHLDGNNMFLQNIDQDAFDNIVNNIVGFSFANIKIATSINFYFNDSVINFTDLNNINYKMINQYSVDYFGGFVGSYETKINNKEQDTTQLVSNDAKIKRIKQIVDQANNRVELIIEEIDGEGGYSSRISNLELSNDNIILSLEDKVNKDDYDQDQVEINTRFELTNGMIRSSVSQVINGTTPVEKVVTTSATLDNDGLKIEQSSKNTITIIDSDGLTVSDKDNNDILSVSLEEGDAVVRTTNLYAEKHLVIGKNSRLEDAVFDGENATAVFWIGD